MKIKALCSFCGVVSMAEGEIRDCENEYVVKDLLKAGYVEAAETPPPEKKTKQARGKKAMTVHENQ